MCKLCILGSVFATTLLFPYVVAAKNVQGDINSNVMHPQKMEYQDLKKFCEEEPQVIHCEEFTETLKIKKTSANEPAILEYQVYTGSYQ